MKYSLLIFLLLPSFSLFSQNLYEGRVAFYPFMGNALDAEGANNGIPSGPSLVSDRFGNINSAYEFDGMDDFIEIPDNPAINFGANEDFSISVWVNINPNQNDKEGSNNEILGKWNTSTSIGYPYAIRYWNSNASFSNKNRIFTLKYDSRECGHNPTINSLCEITSDAWHHLVFIKRGNQIEFFQDGILNGKEPDNTIITCNTKNTNPIFIGKRDGDQRYFTGVIDDLSIYNRAITEEEIILLLNEGGWKMKPVSQNTNFFSFTVPDQIGISKIDEKNQTINLDVVCGTNVKELIPDFNISMGASVSIDGVSQTSGISIVDFSQPLTYTVTSKNPCIQQDWIVYVHQKDLDQKHVDLKTAFLSFTFPEQKGSTKIDIANHQIELEVECSSDLSSLVASFTLPEGAQSKVSGNIQQSGITKNDFSNPVVFQTFNNEECAVQDWTVHVKMKKGSEAEKVYSTTFQSFFVSEQTNSTIIDTNYHTISIEITCFSEIKNLIPFFTLPEGSTAKVSGKIQKSGSSAHDFSSSVIYQIANENYCVFQDWRIFISKESISREMIDLNLEEFKIPNVFTPNDDKTNETFEIGTFFQGSNLSIFNRYGKLVYFSDNYNNQFNGENLSAGTYFYSIWNPCIQESYQGYFLIMR